MIHQGISDALLGYLSSRNNDINGYWGIGILCKYCIDSQRKRCGVHLTENKLNTMQSLKISSYPITEGLQILQRIKGKQKIDHIRISLRFSRSTCRDFGYTDWYTCDLSVLVLEQDQFGFSHKSMLCWPHTPSREQRRMVVASK